MPAKQEWPKIRIRSYKVKNGVQTSYEVDCGHVDGKRFKKCFKRKKDAELWAAKKRTERNRLGLDALRLSDDQKKDAILALAKLEGLTSLEAAADFYLRHVGQTCAAGVEDIAQQYYESLTNANRRPATVQAARVKINRFIRSSGIDDLRLATPSDLEEWLNAQKFSPANREAYLRYLRAFFGYAMKRGYIATNPASHVEKPQLDSNVPQIMDVDEVKKLFGEAEKSAAALIPYLAIGFFAGLRPSEIKGLHRKDVDLDKRIIAVVPQVAKKRRQRYVDISENLSRWLERYAFTDEIYWGRKPFVRLREKCVIDWPHNVMRHSYASYHLGLHQDAAKPLCN